MYIHVLIVYLPNANYVFLFPAALTLRNHLMKDLRHVYAAGDSMFAII